MEDFERYGDYNEIDEPPSKNKMSMILAIAAISVIAIVAVVIGIRLFTFNHYPKAMKTLYFNDTLTEYYNANDGDIDVYTQKLRAPYDDAKQGNFFVSELMLIPEIDQLQLCMRYNNSLSRTLLENYGFDGFDPENEAQFSFKLWRDGDEDNPDGYEIGRLSVAEWESYAMYRYCKLVFDGVELGIGEDNGPEWIRLEIYIDGFEGGKPFMIAVYENNEEYSKLDEYKFSKGEKP